MEKKANAKKLNVDLHSRKLQEEILRPEFKRSTQKLTPIFHAIESTDSLIDRIVYKLYGHTGEEIRIMEDRKYQFNTCNHVFFPRVPLFLTPTVLSMRKKIPRSMMKEKGRGGGGPGSWRFDEDFGWN